MYLQICSQGVSAPRLQAVYFLIRDVLHLLLPAGVLHHSKSCCVDMTKPNSHKIQHQHIFASAGKLILTFVSNPGYNISITSRRSLADGWITSKTCTNLSSAVPIFVCHQDCMWKLLGCESARKQDTIRYGAAGKATLTWVGKSMPVPELCLDRQHGRG